MDAARFDALSRALARTQPRRALALSIAALLASPLGPLSGAAKKRKKKKNVKLCLDGRTIKASKSKKKKLLKKGATAGACPTGCTPQCAGMPCGEADGCGGICGCPAGSICHGGACQACTVVCGSDSAACGAGLRNALARGGTVYACPGRYVGNFTLAVPVTLIGAGQGEDPTNNTVLDANGNGGVINVPPGVAAALQSLRITGGSAFPPPDVFDRGGGILNHGDLTLTDCTVSANAAQYGAGIASTGPLTLNGCTVTKNTAKSSGGGVMQYRATTRPVALNGCTISENTSGFDAGGMYVGEATVNITGSAITDNISGFRGGGLHNFLGAITFDSSCRVTGNKAVEDGGGIQNFGSVTLNNAQVSGNAPNNCGGSNAVAGCVN